MEVLLIGYAIVYIPLRRVFWFKLRDYFLLCIWSFAVKVEHKLVLIKCYYIWQTQMVSNLTTVTDECWTSFNHFRKWFNANPRNNYSSVPELLILICFPMSLHILTQQTWKVALHYAAVLWKILNEVNVNNFELILGKNSYWILGYMVLVSYHDQYFS